MALEGRVRTVYVYNSTTAEVRPVNIYNSIPIQYAIYSGTRDPTRIRPYNYVRIDGDIDSYCFPSS